MKRTRVIMTGLAWAACLALAAPARAANPAVILPDGRRVEGSEVRATREGVIVLTTGAGARLEYPKGTRVIMDEPLEMARALELMRRKQFGEAAGVLGKIAEDYRFLGWDLRALKYLGLCHVEMADWPAAIAALDAAVEGSVDLAADEQVRTGLLRALAGAGQRERLDPLLDEMIRKGSRREAAAAQVIRGRARMDAGDVEGALFDFMRTARFFAEVREWVPEAAYKAGECLEKLGEAEKANAFFRQAQEFADSEYGARAKARAGAK